MPWSTTRLDAEPVPLDLEQPVVVVERLGREGGEHRLDLGRAAGAGVAPARSISAVAAGAWLIQIASRFSLTSSLVRPVLTLFGKSSASQPSTDVSPFLWMSSHWSPSSPSNGRLPPRPLVRTIVKRPLSFSPLSRNLSSPSLTALRPSRVGASGSQVPQSQTMTSPAPYCLAGMIAFEVEVLDRVVLDVDGHPPDLRIEGRALRDGPRDEDAVDLEAEVVVEPRRAVALDDEPPAPTARGGGRVRRRFRGLAEVALATVFLEGHRRQCASPTVR